MQFIQITNGKEIDMTSLILKQIQGDITRDEVLQVINDNIVKNSEQKAEDINQRDRCIIIRDIR